ncbi:DUF998 domain-containing protein [Naumannella halotolerans]|uniref:Putative membrane protein n=1 Tax=Naumannella halotolerans TaxID=993414 RepID=A0A4R7J8H4_9ACTN|nr:DUF998 domain-containing protein [Naumannella halotolerans]TDT32827.1 putative membrane protein [Naumannella halotolerans]
MSTPPEAGTASADRAPVRFEIGRYLPACFGLLGLLFGVWSLWDQQLPLMTRGESIGLIAAVGSLIAAWVVYPFQRRRTNRSQLDWRRRSFFTRHGIDTVMLTVAHGVIAFLLCLGIFGLFQLGFVDLTLDPVAGALLIAVATYVAASMSHYSASIPTSVHFTNVLITLLVSGCIGAMLIAKDSSWWQRDFSQLGGLGNLGAFTLNATLVLSGLGVIVLGDYVAKELVNHRTQVRPGGIRLIRWLLAVAGVLMVLIGLIPVSLSRPIHVFFAMAMALTLMLMMALTPLVVLGFDRGFSWASGGAVGVVVAAIFLSRVVGYFSWTAVEVVSSTVIFAWVTVFVRRVADTEAASATEPASSTDPDPAAVRAEPAQHDRAIERDTGRAPTVGGHEPVSPEPAREHRVGTGD